MAFRERKGERWRKKAKETTEIITFRLFPSLLSRLKTSFCVALNDFVLLCQESTELKLWGIGSSTSTDGDTVVPPWEEQQPAASCDCHNSIAWQQIQCFKLLRDLHMFFICSSPYVLTTTSLFCNFFLGGLQISGPRLELSNIFKPCL